MTLVWLVFVVSGIALILAGTKLGDIANRLAESTGLGQIVVGTILLAGVTSLPELVTSASAAGLNVPDIAVGNVFGSSSINLLLLAAIDLLQGAGPLMREVEVGQVFPGMIGILLTAMAVFWLVAEQFVGLELTIGHVGLGALSLIAVYSVGTVLQIRFQSRRGAGGEDPEVPGEKADTSRETLHLLLLFGLLAVMVIAAGIALTRTGAVIAEQTGLTQTLVGSLLIAITNSLPELVGTYGAIRIQAYDLAVGNVLGSNLFNVLMIAFADFFYTPGSILGAVSTVHLITASTVIILSCMAVIGVVYRSKRSVLYLGWDSIAIIVFYALSLFLLYTSGV